jgi:N-methylhydantoinase A
MGTAGPDRTDSLILGIDIGGTFTDVCVLLPEGGVRTTKVSSTPPDFEQGFFAGIAQIAQELGLEEEEFLGRLTRAGHGTTVATNALITRNGAKVALVSTAGHGEAIRMMRGEGRTAGLGTDQIADVRNSDKPEPYIDPRMIAEVHERIDKNGDVIVELDEEGLRATVRQQLESGAETFSVCLLWSVRNGAHERRVAEIIVEEAGRDIYVTKSSDLSNRMGEYERSVAAVLNSFVADTVTAYLDRIVSGLSDRSFKGDVEVMQASGGVATIDRLKQRPLATFQSGPVAGVIAGGYLGEAIGMPNLIAGDMGGTSFDVALVIDGEPEVRADCVVDRHSFYLPTVDVRSIGAGGGSIARFDQASGTLRVGPTSAGARPGPVCYGRGGVEPTVTDACVSVGYLDPTYFLGGRMELDAEGAREAIGRLAADLDMSVDQASGGILAVVEHQMADLIRGVTIARGYDPRDFGLLGYGGAGPQHAANLAKEIGANCAIVPQASASSAWSALGVAAADLVTRVERAVRMLMPFDGRELRAVMDELDIEVAEDLKAVGDASLSVVHEVDVQYEGQIHQISIPVADGMIAAGADVDTLLTEAFTKRYADLYGNAATLPGTPIEVLVCRSVGRLPTPKPAFLDSNRAASNGSTPVTEMPARSVYWRELDERVDTPVYRLPALTPPDLQWVGPAIVEMPQTTVVVPSDCVARTDDLANILITEK